MSNEIVVALGFFGIGLSIAVIAITSIAILLARRFIKSASVIKDTGGKPVDDSVQRRLLEAAEITKSQNDIAASASIPSSNALHSKHKNLMAARYKQLEEQKMTILQSILKDGHDPMVTVFNAHTNKSEEVPLSHFMNIATGGIPAAPQRPEVTPPTGVPAESIRKVEKNGRTFFVLDGGKTQPGKKPTEH